MQEARLDVRGGLLPLPLESLWRWRKHPGSVSTYLPAISPKPENRPHILHSSAVLDTLIQSFVTARHDRRYGAL